MSDTKKQFILISILILAGLLRLWGINFGLPNDRCRPDEYMIAVVALGMGGGDFNPHFFNYPTLFIYVCFACYALYFIIGYAAGIFHNTTDLGLSFLIDPTNFYLISRMLSAMAGILSVYLLYKICNRWFNHTIAVVAALLMAVAPLHVRDSHFGVTDVFMVMLVLFALYYTLTFHEKGEQNNALHAAVFAGLAASTKYNGALILLPLALALYFQYQNKRPWFAVLKISAISFLAFVAAFLLTSPFIIFNFVKFAADFNFEMEHLKTGHLGIILGRGWFHHLRFSLFYGLGWPMLLAGLVGLFFLIKNYGKKALLLLAFPLAYYLLIGRGYTVFSRYSLALIPFLAITAAVCIDTLRTRSRILAGLAALIMVVPCLWTVCQSDRLLTQKDSRLLAEEWFLQNVPDHASVLYSSSVWAVPRLPLAQESITFFGANLATEIKPTLARLYQLRLYHFRKQGTPVYQQFMYNDTPLATLPAEKQPDYIVVEKSALHRQYAPAQEMETFLQKNYLLRHRIQAADIDNHGNHYDQQDAFYLPLSGFHGVQRPGPNLYIYQKKL